MPASPQMSFLDIGSHHSIFFGPWAFLQTHALHPVSEEV